MGANRLYKSPIKRCLYGNTLTEQLEQLGTDKQLEQFAAARQRLAGDPYRPAYHFVAPQGKMNDPNGLCFWHDRFHLFYQAYPDEAGRRQHWGHAVSEDLVYWQDLPLAIYPDIEHKCFSGSTLVESDRVIAIYHGKQAGNMIAVARDPLLLNWQKLSSNPVIPIVEADDSGYPYRVFDPCIWAEEDGYYALSGTQKDGGNRSMRFRKDCQMVEHLFFSKDLQSWRYEGQFVDGGRYTQRGEDGAVPYFWPLGDKHILLFASHMRGSQYFLGDYDRARRKFNPFLHGRFNFGPIGHGGVHAPSATPDGHGGCYVIHNINEGIEPRGWRQIMSLARVLTLRPDHTLGIEPIRSMDKLRTAFKRVGPMLLEANRETVLDDIRGNTIEINAIIDLQDANQLSLDVLRSPDLSEFTSIYFLRNAHASYRTCELAHKDAIVIDTSRSSLRSDILSRPPEIAPFELHDSEDLHLRIFIDRSVVEVFINGRQCLAQRVYPQRPDSLGLSIQSRGRQSVLRELTCWQMKSIW